MKLHKLAASAAAILLAVSALAGCGKEYPQITGNYDGCPVAVIEIENYGTIRAALFEEQCPKTVENFITLAEQDYYDGLTFHRVIEQFMIQGGDPEGNGTGGESCWGGTFEDEFDDSLRNFRGALSMANSGKDSNGSQFFIVQHSNGSQYDERYLQRIADPAGYARIRANEYIQMGALSRTDAEAWLESELKKAKETFNQNAALGYPAQTFPKEVTEKYMAEGGAPWLDMRHTVFGQVIEGMDVVDAIAGANTDLNDTPINPIVIKDITIER
ncbi:MAG: peptidylprolyl isomerase [Oscillospiraceae bacterium]|nr:peptidylprolyl isomerase [Oscillospiraceae bacterium]